MISPAGGLRVYVATRPTDFRKGIDGLALLVQETMGLDPFSGAAFVFRAKRADRIKILVWDQTGIVLVHKRLEGAKFVWPKAQDGVMKMSPGDFVRAVISAVELKQADYTALEVKDAGFALITPGSAQTKPQVKAIADALPRQDELERAGVGALGRLERCRVPPI